MSNLESISLVTLLLLVTTLLTLAIIKGRSFYLSIQSLKHTKEQLQFALLGSGDSLWDWDIEHNIIKRQGNLNQLGYSENELPVSSEQFEKLVHPDDVERIFTQLNAAKVGIQDHFEAEYRVLTKDGRWCWVLDKGRIVGRDQEGNPTRAAGTLTDITARKQTEQELRLAAEVIQSMNEVVVLTDADFNITLINHAFSKLMGQQEHEVLNQPLAKYFSDRHDHSFYKSIHQSIKQNHYWQGEIWQKRINQKEILTRLEIKKIQHFKQSKEFYVVIFSDITAKKRAEDKLIYLANYDTLTGLPNRALFHQRLAEALHENNPKGFSLVCFDVDHFKHINDSLGSGIGDILLQQVALQLRQQAPHGNTTLARFSGDEFIFLIKNATEKASIQQFASQLLSNFEKPLMVEQHEISISPSIGISRFPSDGKDSITLLKNAQTALHFAKARGRNGIQFYDHDIQTQNLRKLLVGNQLRKALEKNELQLVYQPKLDLQTNSIVGVEALLRWHNANIGAIEPDEFIQIAEETGLVNEIGNWVLHEAIKQIQIWQYRFPGLTISVNISTRQFQQSGLYKSIANLLANSGLKPELLELEITETMLMEDPDSAIATLSLLQKMGVKIAVDDFGTGYSSLSYLKRLPINTLKIDKTFIQDLGLESDDEAITRAIISLAKNLNLKVVAEGVETSQQEKFLKESNCDQIQGYYITQALSADECSQFLTHHI